MRLLSPCLFCLCKSLPVPKHISGAGPHRFYNLLLTVLILSRQLHSTVACIWGSSRAVEVAWIRCFLFANGEIEKAEFAYCLMGTQWQGGKAAAGASLTAGYLQALSPGTSQACITRCEACRRVFCHKIESSMQCISWARRYHNPWLWWAKGCPCKL